MCYSTMIKQVMKPFGIEIEVREDVAAFERLNLEKERNTKIRIVADGERLFPFYFAPVLVCDKNGYSYKPMRYQMWPRDYKEDPKHLALFNARRDTIQKPNSLWQKVAGRQHGVLVFEKFYEWVEVADLVKAGIVPLAKIKDEFEKQELAKKKKALASGKKYKATPTALKPPMERKIEISFTPKQGRLITAPVLYDIHRLEDGYEMMSFAIITDNPLPEVQAAGHDRSPVFLKQDAIRDWLSPVNSNLEEINSILDRVEDVYYTHALADVA